MFWKLTEGQIRQRELCFFQRTASGRHVLLKGQKLKCPTSFAVSLMVQSDKLRHIRAALSGKLLSSTVSK